ncbi:MAG: hypothetical protein ACOYOK_02540 [Pseudobdellovibrionaceae bacterium]
MGIALSHSHAVEKLNQIIQYRFGQQLQVQFFATQLAPELSHAVKTHQGLLSSYVLNIPLVYNADILGHVAVTGAQELTQDQKNRIIELTQLVLGPVMYNNYLSRKENNLNFVNFHLDSLDKDIHIINENIPGDEKKIDALYIDTEFNKNRWFHLRSASPSLQFKAAQMMHEMSGNIAFMNLEVLPKISITDQTMSTYYFSEASLNKYDFESIKDANNARQNNLLVTCKKESLLTDFTGIEVDLDRIPLKSKYLEETLEFFMFDFMPNQPLS